ncbi:MAG: amidohydrolase family protein [Candidatus Bruticola sp.]
MDLLITNGLIVTNNQVFKGDIAVNKGTICALGQDLNFLKNENTAVIDAQERLVTPGGVDVHAHMSYFVGGCWTSDTFASGTEAALFGGTTTTMDFVETKNGQSMKEALDRRCQEAQKQACTDFSLHMSILPHDIDNLAEVKSIVEDGCPTFKHYTAYAFTLDDGQLYRSFKTIAEAGGLPLVHAENWPLIQELIRSSIANGKTKPQNHPRCRPAWAEGEAVRRVLDIAYATKSKIFLFHQSCAEDLPPIAEAHRRGQTVFAETCPHYTCLDSSIFDVLGSLPICSPPIRPQGQQLPLAEALAAGSLNSVSSDHCPFTKAEKQRPDSFNKVPGGLSSVETRFMLIKDLPQLSLQRWVEVCCTNPARIMGLNNKGALQIGLDADIVIWSREPYTISAATLHEKADWSPYEGRQVSSKPDIVMVRGQILIKDGQFLGHPGCGQYQKRVLKY